MRVSDRDTASDPRPDIAVPSDGLEPDVKPDAGLSHQDGSTTVMKNDGPLTDEEALRISKTRSEWRSLVAPNLSGGAKCEWKTKFSWQQRTEMILSYIKEHASEYRHLLDQGSAAIAKGAGTADNKSIIIPRRIVEY